MITDRIRNFFIPGVIWLLLKTIANQSPKTRISFEANRQKSRKGCLGKPAKKTKVLVLDLLRTPNETKAATLSAWRLHCCGRDRRFRSTVSDRGLRISYLLATICGAVLFTSNWALTFWIWAACSLSCAVRVTICLCCCATVACNFSTLRLSMAWWPSSK